MDGFSLLANRSYPNLDALYGHPCKWTTILLILVSLYSNFSSFCVKFNKACWSLDPLKHNWINLGI